MKTLLVFRPGSQVEIGPLSDPVAGTVLQVTIRSDTSMLYEVCWWLNGRQTAWLQSHEVRPILAETAVSKIGFQKESP